jgi:hypothetical protein
MKRSLDEDDSDLAEVRHHRFWSLGRKKEDKSLQLMERLCCGIILCGVGIQLDVRQVKRTQLDSRYVFSGGFGTANN